MKESAPEIPAPRELSLRMVSSFDLGGRFAHESKDVIERLAETEGFEHAKELALKGMRQQASYEFSHEPAVLAADRVPLKIEGWPADARHSTIIDPAGVITFETTIPLEPDRLKDCSELEDAFDTSNMIRYGPYLEEAFKRGKPDPNEQLPEDVGIDLITSVGNVRGALDDLIKHRPKLYPAIDMRLVVSALVDDLGEADEAYVAEFVRARRARAQLSTAPPAPARLEGHELRAERTEIVTRRWGSVLFVSCDADAVLILADDPQDRMIAEQCVTLAHRLWFLARTWVGVLERIDKVEIDAETFDPELFRKLERDVLDLSTLEYEIEWSMTTVEAAGIMLRDTWNVQLVRKALEVFDVAIQRRLIDQRVRAVARNHDTVAEVLNRIDQQEGRRQADRLQLLFAAAVAAALTALIPPAVDADPPIELTTYLGTAGLWFALAVTIYLFGRRPVPLGKPDRVLPVPKLPRRSRKEAAAESVEQNGVDGL